MCAVSMQGSMLKGRRYPVAFTMAGGRGGERPSIWPLTVRKL